MWEAPGISPTPVPHHLNAAKFIDVVVTYVGSTQAQAQAKQAEVDALLPTEQSLAQLGMFVQHDCSNWDLDAPVPPLPPLAGFTGPKGRYATILRIIQAEQPTVRQLLGRLAAGGGHCTMVGTPEQIADQIELWFRTRPCRWRMLS